MTAGRRRRRRRAGRAVRPHPVLRLALPVLRLRRRTPARRRAAREPGRRRSSRRSAVELDLRADALDAAFGAGRGRRSRRVYLGGGTPSLLPAETVAGLLDLDPRAVRHRRRRRGHARGQPRARRARRRRALCARPASPGCRSAPRRCRRRRAPAARPAASGRRRRPTPSPRPASGRHRLGQPRPPVRRPRRLARRLDRHARGGARPRAGPPVALRADARRPGRRGADRAERRPPADDGGRAPLARASARPAQDEDRAAAEYHHAVHRLADDGWRGYEISNWARPGHESRHNLAYWERRPYEAVGPGRARLRRRDAGAGTRPGSMATSAALTPPGGAAAALPPGGAEVDRPGDRGRRGGDPRPADGPRRPARRRPTSRHSADAFGWALAAELLDVDRRRPGRPDDARPPALERAVRSRLV